MGTLISRIFSEPEPVYQEYNQIKKGDVISQIHRQQANTYALERNKNFTLSKNAYEKGNHNQAKNYSQRGKRNEKRMHEENKKAAEAIFNYLNGHERPENRIDLHGLTVTEAMERLKERLEVVIDKGYEKLSVIVGRGIHSGSDGPKLKPAVIRFATELNISYQIHNRNDGCIIFNLTPSLRYTAYLGCNSKLNSANLIPHQEKEEKLSWLGIFLFIVFLFFASYMNSRKN